MKDLVYTCVFDNYDWVLPPVQTDPDTDYILITDENGPRPKTWQRIVVDPADWGGARLANRFWKIVGYRELVRDHQRTLYVDANIRILGKLKAFLSQALPGDTGLGIFAHPLRHTIEAEAAAVSAAGKVAHMERVSEELAFYKSGGFEDDAGLSENTILSRRRGDVAMDDAMTLWWDLYQRYSGRDQLSLPYVRWKTGIATNWIDWSFRKPNPHFSIYDHRGKPGINPFYCLMDARSHDGIPYSTVFGLWKSARAVRRSMKRERRVAP